MNHTLKSMSEKRWNTLYIMAESILSEYDNVIKILNERNEIHIYSLDKNLLDGVKSTFKHFNSDITALSSSSIPTLNIVILKIFKLKMLLKINSIDCQIISLFKSYLINGIENKVENRLNEWHYLALILDPRFKYSKLFSEQKLNETKVLLKKLVSEVDDISSESINESDEPISVI